MSGSESVLYRFSRDLDPDPYQSLVWIRMCNEFFQVLDMDPDLDQNVTDTYRPVLKILN